MVQRACTVLIGSASKRLSFTLNSRSASAVAGNLRHLAAGGLRDRRPLAVCRAAVSTSTMFWVISWVADGGLGHAAGHHLGGGRRLGTFLAISLVVMLCSSTAEAMVRETR